MTFQLAHDLKIPFGRDAEARQDFVSALRGYILNDMAADMKSRYEHDVAPSFARKHGRLPEGQDEVHDAMRSDALFKFYSAIRVNAQEMVWRSVIPAVDAALPLLDEKIESLSGRAGGSLTLNPALDTPRNVAGLDVHLMPGGYAPGESSAAGAIYDNGLAVFSAGFMGKNFDDIGLSMANYVRETFSDFAPNRILDAGCTIGHNTLAWARTYPDAETIGIDVAASTLRYAHGRAESLGIPAHFAQMNATALDFPDNSFDIVFDSMFLHELPLKDIRAFFREAYRVLRPGGLVITMELPPNQALEPYDQFYLDWDCYYNREPYYRAYRDQSPEELVTSAGFARDAFFEFTVPQYSYMSPAEFSDALKRKRAIDGNTGRLSAALEWYGFAAWKR
jgi:SAM-dependent methyltransferase